MSEGLSHLHVRKHGEKCGDAMMNGLTLSISSSTMPYDISGRWLAEMNRACDRFLWSRGIDPATGQRAPWMSSKNYTSKNIQPEA